MKTETLKVGQRVISWKGIFGECGEIIGIVNSIECPLYEVKLDGGRGKVYDKRKNLQII